MPGRDRITVRAKCCVSDGITFAGQQCFNRDRIDQRSGVDYFLDKRLIRDCPRLSRRARSDLWRLIAIGIFAALIRELTLIIPILSA